MHLEISELDWHWTFLYPRLFLLTVECVYNCIPYRIHQMPPWILHVAILLTDPWSQYSKSKVYINSTYLNDTQFSSIIMLSNWSSFTSFSEVHFELSKLFFVMFLQLSQNEVKCIRKVRILSKLQKLRSGHFLKLVKVSRQQRQLSLRKIQFLLNAIVF